MSAKALKLVNRTRLGFLRERVSERFWEAALRRNRDCQDFEFYVLPGDKIGNITISNGLFERREIQALEHLLKLRRSSDAYSGPGVFLDVGANIGAYSVVLSSLFAQVIAFEPNPIVANILRANVAQNRCLNVTVVEKALGAEATKASLFSIEKWNVGMASLTSNEEAEEIAKVDVVRGDDFLGNLIQQDVKVELLKIDVEGHEPYALQGLMNILKAHQPLIAFEVRGAKLSEEITGVLNSAGYRYFYWVERPKWRATMGRLGRVFELIWLGADIRLTPIQTFSDTFYSMVIGSPTPIDS
jgi:FkbM family methyltransferase